MTTGNEQEWTPKTREDWVGMFADGVKNALSTDRSEQEELAAKTAAEEAAKSADASGDATGGEGGSGDKPRKSLAERLLGI
jgi:hypothetical protein